MKFRIFFVTAVAFFAPLSSGLHAEETLELKTTVIKGNKELPQILYFVPWQETKKESKKSQQNLTLHSLYGDLFDPLMPDQINSSNNKASQQ